MTIQEKIALIEGALKVRTGSLTEDTELSAIREWDSLSILGLQVQLSAINPDLQFEELFGCDTIGEVCELF